MLPLALWDGTASICFPIDRDTRYIVEYINKQNVGKVVIECVLVIQSFCLFFRFVHISKRN